MHTLHRLSSSPASGVWLLFACLACFACGEPASDPRVFRVANRCYAIGALAPGVEAPLLLGRLESGEGYAFSSQAPAAATPFFLKPSGLGTYLFYDEAGGYLVSDGAELTRDTELESDVLLDDDGLGTGAEWAIEFSASQHPRPLRVQHLETGVILAAEGVVADAAEADEVVLFPRDDCTEHPEASLDAIGRVRKREFDDGTLFGIVDTHSHIFTNLSFGGGGIFHGAPFHPLGVEHALSDCLQFHGEEGRQDVFGFGFENPELDPTTLLGTVLLGATPSANHATAGWPEFTDWPDAHQSSTHQTQYYRWLERAYLGGLRLVVQHATSNQIICDLIAGLDIQPVRYDCNDMVAVDRIIEATYALQDYVDAQEGGPGKGWFRIVTSPAEAREVIRQGRMAVVLGIETSNLFDCFLVPPAGFEACTEESVLEALDRYHARGIRAIFPVHKYDNAFSAGDGQKVIIELGNIAQTGHFLNFTPDCPDVPTVFDRGRGSFRDLISVRDDYFGPPPIDNSQFATDPIATIAPFLPDLLSGPTEAEVCQATGLTDLGEFLFDELMKRGMIIEIDHLPRRSYRRAFEILEAADYPAAGTHGLNNDGRIYAIGGVSKTGLGRCQDPGRPGAMADSLRNRVALIQDNGGFPAEGFGFDLNGFAGAPGPRFGPDSVCGDRPQEDPITYPFESYAGDVVFEPPQLGDRSVDFNTEGFVHVGLLPELVEDARRGGVSDADLEPLFRSAEGYLRMWEKAEQRAAELAP